MKKKKDNEEEEEMIDIMMGDLIDAHAVVKRRHHHIALGIFQQHVRAHSSTGPDAKGRRRARMHASE